MVNPLPKFIGFKKFLKFLTTHCISIINRVNCIQMNEVEEEIQIAFTDHKLELRPENLYSRYGCRIEFTDNDRKDSLRYTLDIEHIGKSSIGKGHLYRIDRSKEVYVNDKYPNLLMEELAMKVSKAIYPIEIETFSDGRFKGLNNFEEIQKRWPHQRRKIETYHVGEDVQKYLNLYERVLKNESVFINRISRDWFLRVLFESLYVHYTDQNQLAVNVGYPVAGSAGPVNYSAIQEIDPNPNSPIHIVKIKGHLNDERCAMDLEQGLTFQYFKHQEGYDWALKGKCEVLYGVNSKTGIIEGIQAEFDTLFDNPKNVKLSIFESEKLTPRIETEPKEKEGIGVLVEII